jgi:hypothetical protein
MYAAAVRLFDELGDGDGGDGFGGASGASSEGALGGGGGDMAAGGGLALSGSDQSDVGEN